MYIYVHIYTSIFARVRRRGCQASSGSLHSSSFFERSQLSSCSSVLKPLRATMFACKSRRLS